MCVKPCSLFVQASQLWFVFTSVAKHTVLHMFASLHYTCVYVCEKRGLTVGHWLLSWLPAAVSSWEFSFRWVFICVDCEHLIMSCSGWHLLLFSEWFSGRGVCAGNRDCVIAKGVSCRLCAFSLCSLMRNESISIFCWVNLIWASMHYFCGLIFTDTGPYRELI